MYFAGDDILTTIQLQPGETEEHFLSRIRAVGQGVDPRKNEADIITLQGHFYRQFHAANQVAMQARDRRDVAGVNAGIRILKIYRNRYGAAGAGQLELSNMDRAILGFGKWVNESLKALPGAISAVPMAILKGLLPIALTIGIGYVVLKEGQRRYAR